MFREIIDSRVRPLAEALVKNGFERLRVADAELEIELRRAPGTRGRRSETADAGDRTSDVTTYDLITADLVGRVHFVRPPVLVGTLLEGDRELASIEALGIRNPIRSHGAGRVAVVYVEEGQAVDYGAPLFAIDRSGR